VITARTIQAILLSGDQGEKSEPWRRPGLSSGNEHHRGLEKPSEINWDEY
jgi:hypothetical protein